MIAFGRDICGDLSAAGRREWLVTNGIGGYAAGTLAGLPTRSYHGLLIAALNPPLGRTLLLTALHETVAYDGHIYPLFAVRWQDGRVEPRGFDCLERFSLEGTIPLWSYACADALLEKQVWMEPGSNTTRVRYRLRRASRPMELTIAALVNCRDHHAVTPRGAWTPQVAPIEHGLQVTAFDGVPPLYLLADHGQTVPCCTWREGVFLGVEDERGLPALDAHCEVGLFRLRLEAGQAVTFVASTEPAPDLDGAAAYTRRRAHEADLLARAAPCLDLSDPAAARLVLAADPFIVRRALPGDPDGRSVIAGYPWFGDWGRDTMIALPGLTLATGRPEIAARILRTFAHFVDRGMLPNRFPDEGQTPEYNTVDATLWYFEAIRAYHQASGDDALLSELFPVLQDIVSWHQHGTRYNIHVDPADGLLYAGEPGVQLTWMDAQVDDWVVTPRIGKPVEVNALWYNALCSMAAFAARLGADASVYRDQAGQARAGFARFWNPAAGYCYDVIDGPAGNDAALRPNQLLAVSLLHSPLLPAQQRAVVDACARRLLTSHGLRSLSPDDPAYVGRYGGDRRQRDGAYHQGTVWAWLIGPFVSAYLRVYGDRQTARSFLRPLLDHLADHGLGSISEIFDGDPPFTPRGCFAQAWSVAELLRVMPALSVTSPDRTMPPGP